MQEVIIKRHNGTDWDKISLWQKDAVKMHEHALDQNDPIITQYGYNFAYAFLGDRIVGFGPNKWITHDAVRPTKDHDADGTTRTLPMNGVNTHIVGDGVSQALGCMYHQTGLFYYDGSTGKQIFPSESEHNYIGVAYVDGLWIALSETNVYYSINPGVDFDSIKVQDKNSNLSPIRFNDLVITDDGSNYHVVGISFYGAYIDITVAKGSKAITNIEVDNSNKYGSNICNVGTMATTDGVGTGLMIFSYDSKGLKIRREITAGNFEQVSIDVAKVSTAQSVKGFECAPGKYSFVAINSSMRSVNSYIYSWDDATLYRLDTIPYEYNGGEIHGVDNGDYFAAYIQCSGKQDTQILSSRNGINWWTNWGYIYKENANCKHYPITTALSNINSNERFQRGSLLGNGDTAEIEINIDFVPKIITMTSKGQIENYTEYKDSGILTDRNDDTWKFRCKDNTPQDVFAPECLYYLEFNFDAGIWYLSYTLAGGVKLIRQKAGTCQWEGNKIVYTVDTSYADYINKEGYVYNWRAIKYDPNADEGDDTNGI